MTKKRFRGCFSSARKLKNHNPAVLCDFLELFPKFLEKAEIRLPIDRDPDKIPYDSLFNALVSEAPNMLTMPLIFIDDLANETGWREVEFEVKKLGIPIPPNIEKFCYADRVMQMWTMAQPDHPDLLEKSYGRARIHWKASYTYYPSEQNIHDRFQSPDDSSLKKLEIALDVYFCVEAGTEVLKLEMENETWFLIHHPGAVKWKGIYENDQVKCLALTPERYDAVVYHKKDGDLRINAYSKTDHSRYLAEFGNLLFGSTEVFNPKRKVVSLNPLWEDAEEVCRTGDIPGLHEIRIYEVSFQAMEDNVCKRVTWQAEKKNMNLPLTSSNRVIPDYAETLLSAKFCYRLEPKGDWHVLTVHSGNKLKYDHDGDSFVLEQWLRERKFIHAGAA